MLEEGNWCIRKVSRKKIMTPNWSIFRNVKKCGRVGRGGVKEQFNQSVLQSSRKGEKAKRDDSKQDR